MKSANPRILTINSGSSRITFSRYRMDKQEEILVKGSAEGIGLARDPIVKDRRIS